MIYIGTIFVTLFDAPCPEFTLKKPQLLVREVKLTLVAALKKRAAANGRSAESEHRMILEEALRGPKRISLAEALMKIPHHVDNSDFEHRDGNGAAEALN